RALAEGQANLRGADARAALLGRALEFLERLGGGTTDRCPVCESETADLLGALHRKLVQEGQAGPAGEAVEQLKRSRGGLQRTGREYGRSGRRLAAVGTELAESRREVGRLVRRELPESEDALAALKAALDDTGRELDRLSQAIQAKQVTLAGIDEN